MSHSKGPWRYDAESGAVHTTDRTGYWGPDHYPVEVCAVAALDGVNNGPLLSAAPELLEACIAMSQWGDGNVNLHTRLALFDVAIKKIRAAIAKAEGKQ